MGRGAVVEAVRGSCPPGGTLAVTFLALFADGLQTLEPVYP